MVISTHFQRFPCMMPRIGCNYRSPDHKRLLVLGESHYLPRSSIVHSNDVGWYELRQDELAEEEVKWISTGKIITDTLSEGFKNKAHGIYRNIAREINDHWLGLKDPNKAIDHVAYCNYFLRPAVEGISLEVTDLDEQVAEEVFKWILDKYEPELVVFTSSLAGSRGRKILKEHAIPCTVTPHPTCQWWNRTAKKYGGVRGRDLLTLFLREHQWHTVSK